MLPYSTYERAARGCRRWADYTEPGEVLGDIYYKETPVDHYHYHSSVRKEK